MSDIRARTLQGVFQLLYGPFVFLHEPIGRMAFGRAWPGRRAALARAQAHQPGATLELGCGEGRLLLLLTQSGVGAVGLDRSRRMLQRAAARAGSTSAGVVQADAQRLPFQPNSFGRVLVSYPGPWIASRSTWDELARVCLPGAPVIVLLGGDYRRGSHARLRGKLASIAYGQNSPAHAEGGVGMRLAHPAFHGRLKLMEDRWGTAVVWIATRKESSAGGG